MSRRRRFIDRLPKICGADVEQANFILGRRDSGSTGAEAARALLREIDGLPLWTAESWSCVGPADDSQDWGRRYLASTGGCAYIDCQHAEVALPESSSAHDHVATWHAAIRILRRAQRAANDKLPPGERLQVLVNNSDGRSHSYGSHLNFLIGRRGWNALFNRRLHHLLHLASFQASSVVVTGQGKVGAENGGAPVPYQISQRADFYEVLCGVQTTERRPLVNSRDEALCGEREDLARLHCIFFDSTLCHGSSLLKVGLMQIVLAQIEAGDVDPSLVLEDPVAAVRGWSRDPGLRARMRLVGGERLTAVELQRHFLAGARRFAAGGGCRGIVPRAEEILDLWEDTLRRLEMRDFIGLAGRLDWILKLHVLQRALRSRPDLGWHSPEIKHLDQMYGSVDDGDGLYWSFEAAGVVERLVDESRIAYFVDEPPEDTRAWLRAHLLRAAPPGSVLTVDWDRITFLVPGVGVREVAMPDPRRGTRAEVEALFRGAPSLPRLLQRLGARPVNALRPEPLASWRPEAVRH